MDRTVLQVPVSATLKNEARRQAQKLGFSSLQEAVRLFLAKLAIRAIDIRLEEKPVRLSPKNARRYDKMIEDIETGRVKTKSFQSVDPLMKYLNK